MTRRRLLAISGVGVAACSLPSILGGSLLAESPEDEDLTTAMVLAAWRKRGESVKSFRYDCQVETTALSSDAAPLAQSPKGAAADDQPQKTVETCSFCVSGKKMAYLSERREPDDSTESGFKVCKDKAVFDGASYKILWDAESRMPMGQMTRDDKFHAVCYYTLKAHQNNMALWLWFSPTDRLQLLGHILEGMTARRQHVACDGHDCVEFSVPRTNPAWQTSIFVDRARDCLPVQLIQDAQGSLTCKLLIRYSRDESVGWRVSDWEYESVSSFSSARVRTVKCKVTNCTVNKPIADEVFHIEFPEGAHVVEHINGTDRYFIVLPEGKRQPIDAKNYGEMPGPETP